MGVDGRPDEVGARELTLAVRGVGAPIKDFRGVCDSCDCGGLAPRLLTLDEEEERKLRVADAAAANAGLGFRPFERKGWRVAGCGLRRRSGSQVRHLAMKSMNSSSSQRRTCARVFDPARRRRPFEFTTGRGAPVESVGNEDESRKSYRKTEILAHRRRASCESFY